MLNYKENTTLLYENQGLSKPNKTDKNAINHDLIRFKREGIPYFIKYEILAP
jgi:hypothetical protein